MQTIQTVLEVVKIIAAMCIPLYTIIKAIESFKTTGKIDLDKTKDAVFAVLHLVQEMVDKGMSKTDAVRKGVDLVETHREHPISPKLRRKAADLIHAGLTEKA